MVDVVVVDGVLVVFDPPDDLCDAAPDPDFGVAGDLALEVWEPELALGFDELGVGVLEDVDDELVVFDEDDLGVLELAFAELALVDPCFLTGGCAGARFFERRLSCWVLCFALAAAAVIVVVDRLELLPHAATASETAATATRRGIERVVGYGI